MGLNQDKFDAGERLEAERLTLGQIFGLIGGGWRVILTTVGVMVVLAALLSVLSPKEYRTFYIAMPAPSDDDLTKTSAISLDILGQKSGSPEWQMYMSLLSSTRLADHIVKTTPVLQRLLPKQWDAEHKRWKTTLDYDSLSLLQKIKWWFGTRTAKAPDKFTLQGYLVGNLKVSNIPETTQVMVSLDSPDPQTSLMLLTAIHKTANDIISHSREVRATSQRAQLLSELQTTNVVDYRQTLLSILSKVQTTIMTASVGGDYAAIQIDGPVIEPDPVLPKPKLYLELAVALVTVIGVILVVFSPLNDVMLLALWRRIKALRAQVRASRPARAPIGRFKV